MYNQNDSQILLEKLDALYQYHEYDQLELKKFSREERLRFTQQKNVPKIKFAKLEKTILDF